jgi:peptidoglycan/xylan/chitin deacetylase (PgdA/CDA1 family)
MFAEVMPGCISPLRWYLKKAARTAMMAGTWSSGGVRSPAAATPQVRALTYHRFGSRRRDPFCVTAPDFTAQMVWLAKHRLAAGVDDIKAVIADRSAPASGKVIVTIDDGYRSTLTAAMPVLRDCGIPAIAFVTPSLLGSKAGPKDPEPYMTWDELGRLAEAGITIGSHSWRHRSLGLITPSEAEEEAERSRYDLERHLGRQVTTFAYPFGTRADFSATTTAILAKAGYELAFTSQHGVIQPGLDPLVLPRVKIEGGEGLPLFKLAARGALDGWKRIDALLWRVQLANRG